MRLEELIKNCEVFGWDSGNSEKNWLKHKVSKTEAEQIFFNQPLILFEDEKHFIQENLFFALGKTNSNRTLLIVFTFRSKNLIRVISSRDMSKKESFFMKKTTKKIPKFKNEDEERDFWSKHDLTDYVDASKAKKAISPNLKPSTSTISLRLPEILLDEIKAFANSRDVSYQSLIKILLAEKVMEEKKKKAS